MKAKGVLSKLMLLLFAVFFYQCTENVPELVNDDEVSLQEADLKCGHMKTHIKVKGYNFGDISEAQGVLDKITLKCVGNTAQQKFTPIYNQWETFDILNMNVGILADIAFVPIPQGVYDKAIVHMLYEDPNAWVVYKGEKYPFKVPGENMVIKFINAIEVVTSLSQDIVLEIDISKSFIPVYAQGPKQGKKGIISHFIFKPVVKAINLTSTGSIFIHAVNGLTGEVAAGAEIWLNGEPLYCDELGTICTTLTEPIYHPYYPPGHPAFPDGVILFDVGQFVIPGLTPDETYLVEVKKDGLAAASEQTIIKGNFSFAVPMVLLPEE